MPKFTYNIEKAKKLHREGNASQLHGGVNSKLIKAAVYGANDGIITTFAVVAGVAGAQLSPLIVLALGFANLFADGLSMGIGDYLGERSEQKFKRYQFEIEKWEIENIAEEEKKELVEFFQQRKVTTKDAQNLVSIIKKYPQLWAELGFIDEMGETPPPEEEQIWQSGVVTFIAFVVAGALPLLPYVLQWIGAINFAQYQFESSIISTGVTLFVVGSLRTLVTKGKWWENGAEGLLIGALAAVVAYFIGAFVHNLAG